MSNALLILSELDKALTSEVELTLYGRAALQLGFDDPLPDFAVSMDVDAVLFFGQAEQLMERSNFWDAVDSVNRSLADQELYISHFFVEDQVILRPDWKQHRCALHGNWANLKLYRLSDADLLLSKLMRDDPIDQKDALFIVERASFDHDDIETILASARMPDSEDVSRQFSIASQRLLSALEQNKYGVTY